MIFLLPSQCAAQGPTSNWFFGNQAAFKFIDYQPVNLPNSSAMSAGHGVATVSNIRGELEYYAQPETSYNRQHQVVQNGGNLNGIQVSWQGAMLIPHMADPNRHFLITNQFLSGFGGTGHHYHQIKKTWKYPTGEIMPSDKNLLFSDSTGERLTAVHHANGRHIWLIVRFPNSDSIGAFLLTEHGVQQPPVISYSSVPDTNQPRGQMKASPKGDFLGENIQGSSAAGENIGMLHRFDRATGKASSTLILPAFDSTVVNYPQMGCEFSQSSNNFFMTFGSPLEGLLQYSIVNYDSSSVNTSRFFHQVVANGRSMQIGIDSKIYISNSGANILCIENPDAPAAQLIVNDSAFSVAPGNPGSGLPDFVQTFFHPAYFDYSRACSHDSIKFWSRNGNVDSVLWDFGDPASGASNASTALDPTHSFSTKDTFGVTLWTYHDGSIDSFYREIILYDPPSLSDVNPIYAGCQGEPLEVTIPLTNEYTGVLWEDNLELPTRVFTEPTVTEVIIYNFCDTITAPVRVEFDTAPRIELGNDTAFCGGFAAISPKLVNARLVWWSNGDTGFNTMVEDTGLYTAFAANGCDTVFDDFRLFRPDPPSRLGNSTIDTCVDLSDAVPLPLVPEGIKQLVYNHIGENVDEFFDIGTDTYSIVRSSACDTVIDTFYTTISIIPEGAITQIGGWCVPDGLSLAFEASVEYDSLRWSSGETNELFIPKTSGSYTVEVFAPPCSAEFTAVVDSVVCPIDCNPYFPNVFSPNNDGINDFFQASIDHRACGHSDMSLQIFNRWGNLLFSEAHSIEPKWDGFVNGSPASDGVYYYIFTAKDANNQHYQLNGYFHLKR